MLGSRMVCGARERNSTGGPGGIESYTPPTSPPVGLFFGGETQEIVHVLALAGGPTRGNVPDFLSHSSTSPSSIPSYLM